MSGYWNSVQRLIRDGITTSVDYNQNEKDFGQANEMAAVVEAIPLKTDGEIINCLITTAFKHSNQF